jgi:hypothetical protein
MRSATILLCAVLELAGCAHSQLSGWPSVKRAVEESRYADATAEIVKEVKIGYPDQQYAVWKWWEETFGERANYMELSHHLGDSFFALYDHSSIEDRRIIATIFGRPSFDVSLPGLRLRAEVEGTKTKKVNQLLNQRRTARLIIDGRPPRE